MSVKIVPVNYADPDHAAMLIALLDQYARDPMGGGEPLSEHTRRNLAAELAKLAHAFSLLALEQGKPAGLANCIESFSTFGCYPIVNIHDFTVDSAYRGRGISQLLLAAVEEEARRRGCGKITLEVLEGNAAARACYEKFGFAAYHLRPETGCAQFWQKIL